MTSIFTSAHKVYLAKRYKALIGDSTTNLYAFIGKSDPWPDDNSPPTTTDDIISLSERWNTMIALKKVTDIAHAIPKWNWDDTGNTIYVEYLDTDPDLFNHPTSDEISAAGSDYTPGSFYAYTDLGHVYKCISNGGGVKSTVKPTGTSISIIETADGYKWKYMYSVSNAESKKFETPTFIPVKTLASDDGSAQWQVQQAAVDGAVDYIKVLNQGDGNYTHVHSGTAQAGGGANTVKLATGASSTNDWYNGCTVFIDSGTAAGEYRNIIDYDGPTRLATVDANWSGSIPPDATSTYVVTPKITVSGGSGSGLVGRVYTTTGHVTKIGIVASGSGYRFSSGVTVTISGGGGASATARAVISPIGGHGKDAIKELGGFFTITSVVLNANEAKFITNNDYRIVGIAGNVTTNGTTLATSNTLSAAKALGCSGATGAFDVDETITGGTSGAVAILVDSVPPGSGTTTIRYYQTPATGFIPFQAAETITGGNSGSTATITTLVSPDIVTFVGDILQVENRGRLLRQSDQYETIRVIIQH